MSEREEDILKKVLETQERHTSILETIRRGVYGDAENNVLGLLQRQDIDELERKVMTEEIEAIKRINWKISAIFGVAGGTLMSTVIWILKELVK